MRCLVATMLACGSASGASAQRRVPDLGQVSIEDLMNIEITSAARKEQRAADIAAAVFVITRRDIHRSGMRTIPDLLRLVPGVEVAQINSNKWAVSVRGFNGLYANKLLVLIDGRSVNNRMFSGVLWDAEDLILDDVDRIEVMRGPAAALWGANAMNGVINIVTRTAADTQGLLVVADGGRAGEQGAVRYGGRLGATRFRLYSQWTARSESLLAPGARAHDASRSVTTGFRADRITRSDALTLEGNVSVGRTRALWSNLDRQTAARQPIALEPSDAQGGHVLGRWTRTRANGASLQLQSFIDIAARQEPVGDFRRQAADIDTQYHTAGGGRHDFLAGAGYRFMGETFDGRVGSALDPAKDTSSLLTAFMQDEIGLFDKRLAVTLGSQVQYDSASGAGLQPTVRAIWKGLRRQRVWAAASRALRTPSLTDRGIVIDNPPVPTASGLPLLVTVRGNPSAETEVLVEAEAGYRLEIGASASVTATAFAGRYDHLHTLEPEAPLVQLVPSPHILVTSRFGNQLTATTRGCEFTGHWRPSPGLRLDGSYTAFRVIPRLAAASHDPDAAGGGANAPQAQWQVRAAYSPAHRTTLYAALFHVGPLEQFKVTAYTRADVTAEWRLTRQLSLVAIGQNLFDAAHAEFAGAGSLVLATQVPRSASLRLRWRWR